MTQGIDIAIIGGGPAGCALAAACAKAGLRTTLIASRVAEPWRQRYGVWTDLLHTAGFGHTAAQTWDRVIARTESGTVELGSSYSLLDNDRFKRRALRLFRDAGGVLVEGEATHVSHGPWDSHITLRDGRTAHAVQVIDATGVGRFLDRQGSATCFQTAYGILAEVDGVPAAPNAMTWMDMTPPRPLRSAVANGPPTFLYAMPMADGRWFLEETALIRAPRVPLDVLKARLHQRLEHLGVRVRKVYATERCVIPMDAPVPLPRRTLGFGAAASMIHPATGYSVDAAIRLAPVLAESLANAVDDGLGPQEISARGWRALWPQDRRRADQLARFGARTLAGMPVSETRAFFDTFLRLPWPAQRAFLDRTHGPAGLARTYWSVYRAAPSSVRRFLRNAGLRRASELMRIAAATLAGAWRLPRPALPEPTQTLREEVTTS